MNRHRIVREGHLAPRSCQGEHEGGWRVALLPTQGGAARVGGRDRAAGNRGGANRGGCDRFGRYRFERDRFERGREPMTGSRDERLETTTTVAPRRLEVGRIGESLVRADGRPKVKGEFAYSSDLSAPGMLWGHTVRSPHAHARIVADRYRGGAHDAGRPCRPDPRGRSRREALRARVPRPAGARDRPRPLLRRAGRARRGRASRAGAPRGRADPGRVRAARAGHRHGAGDRAARAPPRPADSGARLPRRPTSERRALDRDPPRRPRGRGRGHGRGRLRDRNPGSGVPRARVGPRRSRRRGRDRHPRRDAVAARRPGADRPLPRPGARARPRSPRRSRRRLRRARGRLDADPRRPARPAHRTGP